MHTFHAEIATCSLPFDVCVFVCVCVCVCVCVIESYSTFSKLNALMNSQVEVNNARTRPTRRRSAHFAVRSSVL